MSDYLAGDIVDRCLNTWLLGTYSAQFNQLSSSASATDTELSCGIGLGELGAGSYVAIEDELCWVRERDATNNRLTVVRGVRGTEAVAHASGTALEVNPRFPRFMVRAAMAEELDGWPESLYVPKQIDSDVASGDGTFLLSEETADGFAVRGVIQLRRASLRFGDARLRRTDEYEVQHDLIDGGLVVALSTAIDLSTSFRATVACAFKAEEIIELGDDCDLIDDCGLERGMVEILELGAAYRLLVGRGSVRLFPEAQGQSRTATEVGPRDIPAFASSLLGLQQRAMTRETERLYRKFGFGGS